jgi:hypothetical protein
VRRDGLKHELPITTLEIGQFSGEVSQLAGRATLAAGRAGPQGCTALPFDAPHLRALVIGSADLGEIVMRAFILRRVALIEDGNAGSIICVALDAKGFVVTGTDAASSLQTSAAGVFAIGDVRAGSTKRVAAAVGEGAAVVSQIHGILARDAAG